MPFHPSVSARLAGASLAALFAAPHAQTVQVAAADPARALPAIDAGDTDNVPARVHRHAELRETTADDGCVEDNLWTGIGRAHSDCGAAIVGDAEQVPAKRSACRALATAALQQDCAGATQTTLRIRND